MIITGVLLSEGRICVRVLFVCYVDVDPAPVHRVSASTTRIISTGLCPVLCDYVCVLENKVFGFMAVNTQLCDSPDMISSIRGVITHEEGL